NFKPVRSVMSENFAPFAGSTRADSCAGNTAIRASAVMMAAAAFARYPIFTAALFLRLPSDFETARIPPSPSPAGPVCDRCFPADSAGVACADRDELPIPLVPVPQKIDSDSGRRCLVSRGPGFLAERFARLSAGRERPRRRDSAEPADRPAQCRLPD